MLRSRTSPTNGTAGARERLASRQVALSSHSIPVSSIGQSSLMSYDKKLIVSPLSREFSCDGITVRVFIYRVETEYGWVLEVADKNDMSTIWEGKFPTDRAANEFFLRTVETEGLAQITSDDSPTLH